MKAGSSFLLEPNEYHEIGGTGEEKAKILDIFHPYREDFLKNREI